MQKLTAKMAAIVHQYSNKMVTTGSAAIRWNAEVEPGGVVNFWSDKMLMEANNGDPKSYLDFYQIHYYDHFKASGADPYDTTKSIKYWKFDKPTLIGETPASKRDSKNYDPKDMPELSLKNGYAGNMYWSYNGDDGVGGWNDFKEGNKKFYEAHPNIVRPTTFPCVKFNPNNLQLKVSPTDKGAKLDWFVYKAAYVEKFEITKLKSDGSYEVIPTKIEKIGKNFSVTLSKEIDANTLIVIKQKDVYGYENESQPFTLSNGGGYKVRH
jgi:hypothetical protein